MRGCWVLLIVLTGCAEQPEAEHVTAPLTVEVAAVPAPVEDGWPCLFGVDQSNTSPESEILTDWPEQGPPLLWERPVGKGYSSPVVRDGLLIVHHRRSDQEIVEALDALTGDSRWTFTNPTLFRCRYDYSDGPYSTPTITATAVITLGAETKLNSLNRLTGDLIWKRDLAAEFTIPEPLFACGTTPLVRDGRIYLNLGAQSEQAGIIALDERTGATLWTATDHPAAYSTPARADIYGRDYLFVLTFSGLVCLDPGDGRVHWVYPFRPKKQDSVNACLPLVVGDQVFLTAGPGLGCVVLRILPDGGYEELWQNRRALDSQFNPLIHRAGCIYGYPSKWNGSAYFRCLSLQSGELLWSWESEQIQRGTSLAVAGHFLLLGESGHLAWLEADAQEPRPKYVSPEPVLQAPCYSSPALHAGLLYLRNERKVICLDLRRGE